MRQEIATAIETIKTEIDQVIHQYRPGQPLPTLVAVSKNHSAQAVLAALAAGHRVFGENRVQEAQGKFPSLKQDYPDLTLHLIGPLQTNKVADAVALFDVIQTVDRPKLVRELAKEMKKQNRFLPCFIQVNTGDEPQKAGCAVADLPDLLALARHSGLTITGLMCIPPATQEPAPHFGFLRKLAQENDLENLSMGMSGDYTLAASLGATHIRVGSAIFGQRDYS